MPTCPYEYPADLTAISSAGTGRLTATRLVIGGQAGYNWQAGAFVYGIEVDLNSIPLSSSQTVRGFLPDNRWFLVSTNTDTHWLLTSRGRLGWAAAPQVLLYATGGFAATDMRIGNSFADEPAPSFTGNGYFTHGFSSASATRVGYAVGGGGEWVWSRNWSIKAEYLYVSFDSVSTRLRTNLRPTPPCNPGPFGLGICIPPPHVPDYMSTSASLNASTIRVGLNYKFY